MTRRLQLGADRDVDSAMDVVEALLSPLARLVYPIVVPVLILGPTAWGVTGWSRRRRKQVLPAPMFTQVWAWIGWAVVGVHAFLIAGLVVLAWQPALMLAALLIAPLGVICWGLIRANSPATPPG